MNWKKIPKDLPAGGYIVQTTTKFNWYVMRTDLSYDKNGKQIWSCKRQKVTHYLS